MNLIEIGEKFPTELDAVMHFEKARWPGPTKCPYCNATHTDGKRQKDHRFKCDNCDRSFSVTVGTVLHNTRLPLKTWLFAFAVISDAKKGISAKQLERNIGVHYETAFKMYHTIREIMAMENDGIELDGIVEMDETYIGGKPRKFNEGEQGGDYGPTVIPALDQRIAELKEAGVSFKRKRGNPAAPAEDVKRGRGTKKIPVVGIVQRDGDVVAEVMRNLTHENLKGMVQKYVDGDDAVLITDEYRGYNRIDRIIEHVKIDHNRLYSYKGVNTNSIESFWAIVKRGITGQYHNVSLEYLPNYISEFVFKYNNRKVDDMFATLVKNSMAARH